MQTAQDRAHELCDRHKRDSGYVKRHFGRSKGKKSRFTPLGMTVVRGRQIIAAAQSFADQLLGGRDFQRAQASSGLFCWRGLGRREFAGTPEAVAVRSS